jgi:hypothetical protein
MKGILVIKETLTFFGSLGRDIDTIGSLWGTLTTEWKFEGVMCTFPKEKRKKKGSDPCILCVQQWHNTKAH